MQVQRKPYSSSMHAVSLLCPGFLLSPSLVDALLQNFTFPPRSDTLNQDIQVQLQFVWSSTNIWIHEYVPIIKRYHGSYSRCRKKYNERYVRLLLVVSRL